MPLGKGNVSYVLIYLAQLKIKHCRTVATLSGGGVRFFPFNITQHNSAGTGPGANSIPPYCLRVLVCSSASTSAAVDMNRPRIEQRGHLCTQPWHSSSAIPAAALPWVPFVPIPCWVSTLYCTVRVATPRKILQIRGNNLIVKLR